MFYLLAVHTLHCKLLLIAGHTVVVVVLRDEALGANGLLAPLAGETGLMPTVPLVLHLPGALRKTSWNRSDSVNQRKRNQKFKIKTLKSPHIKNLNVVDSCKMSDCAQSIHLCWRPYFICQFILYHSWCSSGCCTCPDWLSQHQYTD